MHAHTTINYFFECIKTMQHDHSDSARSGSPLSMFYIVLVIAKLTAEYVNRKRAVCSKMIEEKNNYLLLIFLKTHARVASHSNTQKLNLPGRKVQTVFATYKLEESRRRTNSRQR